MNKKEIRKEILGKMKAFNQEDKEKADSWLATQLYNTEAYKNAQSIALVLSLEHEVNTFPIIKQALSDNKSVYVPETDYQNHNMTFKGIHDLSDIEKDSKGIYHSTSDSTTSNDIDLVIVPGVGFQQDGYRIGYGGGYYDKFLTEHHSQTISLLYDFQLVTFQPESFDQPVDKLLIYTTS